MKEQDARTIQAIKKYGSDSETVLAMLMSISDDEKYEELKTLYSETWNHYERIAERGL